MLCLISLLLNTKINVLQHWFFLTLQGFGSKFEGGLLDFKYQNLDKQKNKRIMVTVISSFAKTKLGGEGLSVNRRSNRQRGIIPSWCTSVSINSTASAAHSVHHNIKVIFMQNNFRVQFIFLQLFKPFYFSFPRSTPARYLNLLEECRNGVVINLYCITLYYTILSIASIKARKQQKKKS